MLELTSLDLKKDAVETLVVPVCEDTVLFEDPTLKSLSEEALKLDEFKGEEKDAVTFYSPAPVKAKRVMLAGVGKRKKTDRETLRAFAGKAVKIAVEKGFSEICIAVPEARILEMDAVSVLESVGEGAFLGNHVFGKYKNEEKHKPLKKIRLQVDSQTTRTHSRLPKRIETLCSGTLLAREWVNTPSNDKTPERFARAILQAAKRTPLTCTVLDDKTLKQKKFGSLLAVAAGSQNRPRLVTLEYRAAKPKKTVVLVGKGVTFDSGGLNLKPSGSLDGMKADMSGAAAVAATLMTVAKLKPKMHVVGVMPIVENMPSGTASRPGDIVRTLAGKTVEIGNTDAEGRLILIDAMSYAARTFKPQTMIDLATLTGACVVALGEKIAGVFSPDDALAESVLESGEKTHERCWRMPMPEDYKEELKSDFADLKNIGTGRWGGAVVAALFLAEFVKGIRWAHIDIAGPAYLKKESAYCGPGGTGFGVRLLCDLLEKL